MGKLPQSDRKTSISEASEIAIGENTGIYWQQGLIGHVYTTALNLIILQLENACLPIYQR